MGLLGWVDPRCHVAGSTQIHRQRRKQRRQNFVRIPDNWTTLSSGPFFTYMSAKACGYKRHLWQCWQTQQSHEPYFQGVHVLSMWQPCPWHVVVVKLQQPTTANGSCIIPSGFMRKISKMCCNVMRPDVTRWVYPSCKDVRFISPLG